MLHSCITSSVVTKWFSLCFHHTLNIWFRMEFTRNLKKNQFALINQKLFLITRKINIYISKWLRIFLLRHFFSIWAFVNFYMSRNLAFGFTLSKSHLLPLLFNALELQRTLLINISKLSCQKSLMISEKNI